MILLTWQREQAVSLQFQSESWCKMFHVQVCFTDMLISMCKSNAHPFPIENSSHTLMCFPFVRPPFPVFHVNWKLWTTYLLKLNRGRYSNFNSHRFLSHNIRSSDSFGAWCADLLDMEQWLQVDLLKTTNVSAVATQGDILDGNWVTEYAVNYSCDGVKWFSYTHQGAPVVSHIMIGIYGIAL